MPSAARAAGFTVKGHHFDSGPSFFAGLSGKSALLASSFPHAEHSGVAVALLACNPAALHLIMELLWLACLQPSSTTSGLTAWSVICESC